MPDLYVNRLRYRRLTDVLRGADGLHPHVVKHGELEELENGRKSRIVKISLSTTLRMRQLVITWWRRI
jgi:hypothetical protein